MIAQVATLKTIDAAIANEERKLIEARGMEKDYRIHEVKADIESALSRLRIQRSIVSGELVKRDGQKTLRDGFANAKRHYHAA